MKTLFAFTKPGLGKFSFSDIPEYAQRSGKFPFLVILRGCGDDDPPSLSIRPDDFNFIDAFLPLFAQGGLVFDLFNRMDTFNFIRALNGTTYNTPSPSSTGQTRQVQLGVRLSF